MSAFCRSLRGADEWRAAELVLRRASQQWVVKCMQRSKLGSEDSDGCCVVHPFDIDALNLVLIEQVEQVMRLHISSEVVNLD